MAESSDRTFAIFGVVVVVLAAGFIVAHDDVSSEAARFNWQVTFQETSHDENENGDLQEGDSDVFEYDWQFMNITVVEFVLTWNDDNDPTNQPDNFRLDFEGPNGQSNSEQGSSGTVTLTETLSSTPDTFRVDRSTKAQAQAKADTFASEEGMGNWSVTVTLTNAASIFPINDSSNSYELSIDVTYFNSNLAKVETGGEI